MEVGSGRHNSPRVAWGRIEEVVCLLLSACFGPRASDRKKRRRRRRGRGVLPLNDPSAGQYDGTPRPRGSSGRLNQGQNARFCPTRGGVPPRHATAALREEANLARNTRPERADEADKQSNASGRYSTGPLAIYSLFRPAIRPHLCPSSSVFARVAIVASYKALVRLHSTTDEAGRTGFSSCQPVLKRKSTRRGKALACFWKSPFIGQTAQARGSRSATMSFRYHHTTRALPQPWREEAIHRKLGSTPGLFSLAWVGRFILGRSIPRQFLPFPSPEPLVSGGDHSSDHPPVPL